MAQKSEDTDKASTTKPMRNWEALQDRLDGKDDFLRALEADESVRRECVENPETAKARFAEYGRFYVEGETSSGGIPPLDPNSNIKPIPKATVFRVFDKEDIAKRDELVTIVLPATGTDPEKIIQDWRCTYTPYASR